MLDELCRERCAHTMLDHDINCITQRLAGWVASAFIVRSNRVAPQRLIELGLFIATTGWAVKLPFLVLRGGFLWHVCTANLISPCTVVEPRKVNNRRRNPFALQTQFAQNFESR